MFDGRHIQTFSHKCFHVSDQTKIPDLCSSLSLNSRAASVDCDIRHINAHIHTGHSDKWCPRGRVVKLRPLPPAIFFFFGPSHLSINLLFLPAAHICFLHLHSCWKLLSISLFNPCSPLNTFSYQSYTGFIWSLHNSSSSVSWPLWGLTKQTASSKWNLNLNSEP